MLRSIVFALLLPVAAVAEDLPTFLHSVTEATRPKVDVRAFGTATTESPDGKVEDQIAVVYGAKGDLYLELRKAATRALIIAAGKDAYVDQGGKGAQPFALDALFGATQFTREDLHPFDDGHYKAPRISDKQAFELTATLEGKPLSQYELIVTTFDLAKKVPTKTLYYFEKPNNLVKMRTDGNFASAGEVWLPGSISMQHFQLRAKTTFNLKWEAAPAPAGVFECESLGKPSPIQWPAP